MRAFVVIFCCFLSLPLLSQYIEQYPISPANGDKMFELKNYPEAVRQFTALLKEEPDNLEYKFYLGKAHTYALIDQAKGLALLKEVSKTQNEIEGFEETLALAYFKNHEFDKAKSIYKKLSESAEDAEKKQLWNDWVKQCQRSKEMLQSSMQVSFENLGDEINSEAPDYLPFVEPDESSIFFTSRRQGVVGNLYDYGGYRTADIFTARHRRSDYTRARSVGSPNTYGNEETAGRSENGQFMLYHVDSEDHFSNLFVSEKGRRSYMPPKVFGSEEVNKKSSEPAGALTTSGDKLYFSSDREGGLGGFDLYMVKRLPNGKWGYPKNLGAPINTAGDEMYPFLQGNESVLYFSSNGHPGMGGLDLFKSTIDDESGNWSQIENLGYPVNTVNDDKSICFTANPRYAYIAQKRDDSYGDLDIYRITFHDERAEYTLLSGSIMTADSTLVTEDVLVEIFDDNDGELIGSYLMNKKTSEYHAILPPGKYRIEVIDTFGFEPYEGKVVLHDKNDYRESKKLDIILTPSP